jgi:hypothetical protein
MSFENKIVAVMNKSIDPGIVMNALAHMSIGLGASLPKEKLRLDTYEDQDGNKYPNISQMPFIILRANSNKILSLVQWARENNIKHGVFVDTMTGGTYQEQLDRTKATREDNLLFYGVVLYGPWDKVSDATKKFSLWK